jgi:hypothetical protein
MRGRGPDGSFTSTSLQTRSVKTLNQVEPAACGVQLLFQDCMVHGFGWWKVKCGPHFYSTLLAGRVCKPVGCSQRHLLPRRVLDCPLTLPLDCSGFTQDVQSILVRAYNEFNLLTTSERLWLGGTGCKQLQLFDTYSTCKRGVLEDHGRKVP